EAEAGTEAEARFPAEGATPASVDPGQAEVPDAADEAPDRIATDGPPRARRVPGRRQAKPFRTRWVVPLAILGAIATGVLVAAVGSAPSQRPIASAAAASSRPLARDGYFVTMADLRSRAADAQRGVSPVAAAVEDLMAWAAIAVARSPHPVQPLVVVGNDNVLVDDGTRAYGLGLAYVASGDERYAESAAATIRAWVDEVHWADDTCTDAGGCHTTLSISRAAPGFVFAASLIDGSPAWTAKDTGTFRSWLRSVILPAASERPNNWGDAGTFMRVVVADYLGDETAFDNAIAKWRSLLDLIEPTGRIPEESRRGTAGISYTQEALQYKIAVARIAELRGIDLWDAVGAKGGSLKLALDRLAYFSIHPEEWPDAVGAEVPSPGPAWELAYAHWREPSWAPFVVAVRPYGDRGHSAIRWTTFTNGIPIDPITAGASPPDGSPAATPVPSGSPSPSEPSSPPPTVATLKSLQAHLVDRSGLGDVGIRIDWSAPSVADRVRLEWSTGGSWHRLIDTRRTAGTTVDSRSAGSVSYRGRLTESGTRGPWIERDVVIGRVDASGATLALKGSWSVAQGSGYRAGAALSTNQAGATATWRGAVSELLIIGPVGPTRGRLDVLVDGRLVDSVSLGTNTYQARRVLAHLRLDRGGDHTIVLRAAGSSRTVAIDELVRLVSGPLSSPASTP
ncbi:MAG: alginate lyase family protein, partial [Chloroflexota bacterium]